MDQLRKYCLPPESSTLVDVAPIRVCQQPSNLSGISAAVSPLFRASQATVVVYSELTRKFVSRHSFLPAPPSFDDLVRYSVPQGPSLLISACSAFLVTNLPDAIAIDNRDRPCPLGLLSSLSPNPRFTPSPTHELFPTPLDPHVQTPPVPPLVGTRCKQSLRSSTSKGQG